MAYATSLDGLRTYYEDSGPDDAAPVMLLHGATQDGSVWRSVTPKLVDADFRVLVPDLPGHGKSEWSPGELGYDVTRYAREMAHLVEEVLDRPAVIVGHSMCSGVALQMAIEQPELVRGTLVLDGTSYSKGYTPEMLELVSIDVLEWLEVNFRSICSRKTSPEAIDQVAFGLGRCPEEVAWNDMQAFSGLDLRHRLKEIGSPVAFLHGAEDWAITVEMAEETMARCTSAPTRLLVVDNIGHFPHQEDPDLIDPKLVELVNWVARATA